MHQNTHCFSTTSSNHFFSPLSHLAQLILLFFSKQTEVALLSITACGVGLNLTRANVALFGELNWSLGTLFLHSFYDLVFVRILVNVAQLSPFNFLCRTSLHRCVIITHTYIFWYCCITTGAVLQAEDRIHRCFILTLLLLYCFLPVVVAINFSMFARTLVQ